MATLNASDRKSIRSAEKASALRAIQDREAVASIMSTIPGRAWMWRMLKQASLFNSNFTGEPYRDAFLAGERNFGLRMLNDIMEHCPDAYLQMTKEANNDRHLSDNRSPDADYDAESSALAQRRGGPLGDGGDSGQDSGTAEGPEPSAEAGGWNLLDGQAN